MNNSSTLKFFKRSVEFSIAYTRLFLLIFSYCILFFSITAFWLPVHAIQCIPCKSIKSIKPGVNQPSDISLAPNKDIYLVDGVNNRIVVMDGKGKVKFKFGKKGRGKGRFVRPLGIDISEDGRVFIADTGNHRIQIFDSGGSFLSMFNVKNGSGKRLSDPVDVLVPGFKDQVYISDNDNHKIKVYKQDGSFVSDWGGFGEDDGFFRYPAIMAGNEFNQIFVVDVLNTRVQKFNPFGEHIDTIGNWGVLPGKLFRPKGVAVDKKNRVFISDSYMGVVQVFTDLGRFLGVICVNNRKKLFNTPVGLAVDGSLLYVVEMRANKISALEILH